MSPLGGLRHGAIVGLAGGAAAALVHGALAVGPSLAASALAGALGGLTAGLAWIVSTGLGRATPTL